MMADEQAARSLQTIARPVRAVDQSVVSLGLAPDAETLVRWFETLTAVQQAASGSDAFYQQTARAVVDLVGLDWGMVLLRTKEDWVSAAEYSRADHPMIYSRTVLEQVVREQRTFFQLGNFDVRAGSLQSITAVVASPILHARGEVIGVVYGARTRMSGSMKSDVTPLEAQLVQVLAASVSSGLARMHSESEAARRHVQFEQFVSPQVVRELDRNPRLLDGSDREITALFVDIRNFSRISEKLPALQICDLVRAIMDRLADCVREHEGTTVSYLGDGLLAMWNAPVEQQDHALRACRAALGMLAELPALNRAWSRTLGGELGLGIGINSGTVMVGNTGSHFKPHYGPLGHHVNLASRVEGATKQLGVPILVTGSTQCRLDEAVPTRRLCRARVVGMAEPVEMYELYPGEPTPDWCRRRRAYESALEQYESRRWNEACDLLLGLMAESYGRHDAPTLSLMARTVECLKSLRPAEEFDGAWNLSHK